MKYIITAKKIELTEALKQQITKKIGRLEKYFGADAETHATLSVQRNKQTIEITIRFNGMAVRAEVTADDMYSALDRAADILERQIGKNKTRLSKKLHEDGVKHIENTFVEKEDSDFDIVRTKRFAVKPMSVEEAILQMNLLGHVFFMFLNSEDKEINVVYKRKDGGYGVIEPIV
jgi:putative sigma-54 modulation protein